MGCGKVGSCLGRATLGGRCWLGMRLVAGTPQLPGTGGCAWDSRRLMQGKRPEVEDGEDMALLVALQLTYTNLIFIMDRQSVWDYTQQKVWKGRLVEEIQNPISGGSLGRSLTRERGWTGSSRSRVI